MPKQPSGGELGSSDSGASGGGGQATNSIVIDLSSMGGLANNFWGDTDQTIPLPQRRILVADTNSNQLAQGYFNPWLRQGYLGPGISSQQPIVFSGTAPTGVLSCVVYDPVAPKVYWGENGKHIYTVASVAGATALNCLTFTNAHTVAQPSGSNTGPTIIDMEIYTINGERALFYSFYGTNSGNTNIYGGIGVNAISSAITGSYVDTWLSGGSFNSSNIVAGTFPGLTSKYPLLRLGLGGILYVLDGSLIWGIDGTITGGAAGTIFNGGVNMLGIAPQDQIVDGIAYRGLFYIACQPNSVDPTLAPSSGVNFQANCYVEVWNGTILTSSNSSVVQDIIPVTGIKSIQKLYISPEGNLRMMCVSSNGTTQIREYNGTAFLLISQAGLGAAPMFPDSLTTSDQLTMWTGNDGNIYAHGKVLNQTPEVIAKISQLYAGVGTNPETQLQYPGAILYGASVENAGSTSGYRQDVQSLTMALLPNGGTSGVVKMFPFDKGSIQPDSSYGAVTQKALDGQIYTGVHFLESSTASFYTGTRFISQLSTIGFINVFMAAAQGGASNTTYATIHVFINGNTTEWGAGAGKAVTGADIARGYKRIEMNQPYVNTVQLSIDYATGITLSDSYDFHPYTAIVYYSPTNTRG